MGAEADGWEAVVAKKRVLVLLQPYDLYLVRRARQAGPKGAEAPSPFVEGALRKFIELGTNGGKQEALKAMREAADRRSHGEQLSRRSIRLHGDVNAQLDAFAHSVNESASVIVEAAMDNVLNGEIDDMRADLANAQRIELVDSGPAD